MSAKRVSAFFTDPSGSGESAVEFIDLKEYGSFFFDLLKGFPMQMDSGGFGCSSDVKSAAGPAALPVVQVGNFEASYVPTIKALVKAILPGSSTKQSIAIT